MAVPHARRLAPAGDVWVPGADYEVVDTMPPASSTADAQLCPVFRIRRRGTLYVLVAVPELPPAVETVRAGWHVLRAVPPHSAIIPILHHFICAQPPPGALFLVLPPQGLSVAEYIAQRRASIPLPPYGLGWRWFAEVLLSVLRAVDHMAAHRVIHGHICWENFQLEPELEAIGRPYLTGFQDAWYAEVDGRPVRADLRRKRVGGTGSYRAPDVYRVATAALEGAATAGLLSKAETWTAGRCMYDLLCSPSDVQFFHRIRSLDNYCPIDSRRLGAHYDEKALPSLPATCPPWFAYIVQALVRAEAQDRLSARDAIQMLQLSLQQPPRDVVTVVEKVIQQPVLSTGEPVVEEENPFQPFEAEVAASPPANLPHERIDMQVPYNPLDLSQDRSWSEEAAPAPPKGPAACGNGALGAYRSGPLTSPAPSPHGGQAPLGSPLGNPAPAEGEACRVRKPSVPSPPADPRSGRVRSCPPSPPPSEAPTPSRTPSGPSRAASPPGDEKSRPPYSRSRSPEPPLSFNNNASAATAASFSRNRGSPVILKSRSPKATNRSISPPGGPKKPKART